MAKTTSNSIPADDGATHHTPNSGCNVIYFFTGGSFCVLVSSYLVRLLSAMFPRLYMAD